MIGGVLREEEHIDEVNETLSGHFQLGTNNPPPMLSGMQ